jgi:hypothetical protein
MKKTTDTPEGEEFAAVCGRVWDVPSPSGGPDLVR